MSDKEQTKSAWTLEEGIARSRSQAGANCHPIQRAHCGGDKGISYARGRDISTRKYIIGHSKTHVAVIELSNPKVVAIDEAEYRAKFPDILIWP